MSPSTIAYRYAKALFSFAKEQGVLDEVNNDMDFFIQVSKENPEFIKIMSNPIVRHSKKLAILKNIFENRINNVTYSIFNVLTTKNRENLILPIALEFKKLFNDEKGIQVASVTTATPISESQRKEFNKIIADATGKNVKLLEKIDESLIGGYLLAVDDLQINTSVKKKLNELKLSLK